MGVWFKHSEWKNFEMKIGTKIEIEEKIILVCKKKSFETDMEKQNVLFFKTVAEE